MRACLPCSLETRTDADGQFHAGHTRRVRSPTLAESAGTRGRPSGHRLAIQRLPVPLGPEHTQVELALQPPERTACRVLDPAGMPVVGAMISPSEIDDVPIPDAPADSLAARPMGKGQVVLAALARLQEFLVDAPGFGKQRNRIEPEQVTEIRLAPVGRLAGRVVMPANEPIQGVSVRAARSWADSKARGRAGLAEVACDAAGRFEIPAIAAGKLTLELVFDTAMGPRCGTSRITALSFLRAKPRN